MNIHAMLMVSVSKIVKPLNVSAKMVLSATGKYAQDSLTAANGTKLVTVTMAYTESFPLIGPVHRLTYSAICREADGR